MDVWLPVGIALFAVLVAVGVIVAIPLGLFNRLLRVRPAAGVFAAPRAALLAEMLAMNDEGHPWLLTPAPPGSRGDIVAEWRLADARWWTFVQRNGLSVTYRALVRLDEQSHEVRICESTGRIEWAAGSAAPLIHWSRSFFKGVILFERAREIAYGLTEPTLQLGEAVKYDFNPWHVKAPILRAAVEHGWTYAPVVHEFQLGPRHW